MSEFGGEGGSCWLISVMRVNGDRLPCFAGLPVFRLSLTILKKVGKIACIFGENGHDIQMDEIISGY